MSGSDLTISSGGIVEVDSDALYMLATELRRHNAYLDHAINALHRAGSEMTIANNLYLPAAGMTGPVASSLERTREATALTAQSIDDMAALFEAVELRARLAVDGILAPDTRRDLEERLDHLYDMHPGLEDKASKAESDRAREVFTHAQNAGVVPLTIASLLGNRLPASLIIGGVPRALQTGIVTPGEGLRGTVDPVDLTEESRTHATEAPTSLFDMLDRIPDADKTDAQVRVDRFDMPDGKRKFVVYIDGTRDWSPFTDEPWDVTANGQLYTGRQSASHQAVLQALEAAGAQPDDEVLPVGYSQAAMIVTYLTTDSPYQVTTSITAGGPTQPVVSEDHTVITLAHRDDLVATGTGGGFNAAAGSENSMLIERTVDPELSNDDLHMPGHKLTAYKETASLADASTDPRVTAFARSLAPLAAAKKITTTTYSATKSEGKPAK